MACLHCGAKIGFFRVLKDKEFCSDEHRRRAQARSARAAREARWNYGDEDLYDVYEILDRPADQAKKQQLQKVQASAAMILSIVLVFVLAFSWLGGGTGNAQVERRDVLGLASKGGNTVLPAVTGGGGGGFISNLKNSISMKAPMRLKDDFQAGLDQWVGAPVPASVESGWKMLNGAIMPGRLRLWEPSVSLSDYKMEFEGQIQKSALSWTYRSVNLENFYATKIVMKSAGKAPTLEIVRYAMVNGREQVRTKLPIPLMSIPKSLYHVQMQVRGDQFTTVLNGQVVDTWSNAELKKGGVGFFSDPGEQASIHWVNVNEERGGLLSQILSLGFFSPPLLP